VRGGERGSRRELPGAPGAVALCAALTLIGCISAPPPAPVDERAALAEFSARRLDSLNGLPPPGGGWSRAQWLSAALALNPHLQEERAEVAAVAAAERTAAQHPNPNMELFGEYLTASGASPAAWLYGLSMDFLLPRPGERARARTEASLQTALANSDLTDSIWEVRSALRGALLDAVAAQDESAALDALVAAREGLLESDRARLHAGDIGRGQLLGDELELGRARQRAQQVRARSGAARARLAATIGVPLTALEGVTVQWPQWDAIDQLTNATPALWREQALIGRPQVIAALRAYDLAELKLQHEVGKRWPQLRVTPAYAWGGSGVRQDALDTISNEAGLGLSFELPIFNQHQGEIGEALGRRTAAGEHLKSVQAQIFEQIDRAELAWPAARDSWSESARVAQLAAAADQAEQRAFARGASDRAATLAAQIAASEAHLTMLDAAYEAQLAFGALEDAYRRPLEGAESLMQAPQA
jgi:outer membrane protein, heavy metal efflux system